MECINSYNNYEISYDKCHVHILDFGGGALSVALIDNDGGMLEFKVTAYVTHLNCINL